MHKNTIIHLKVFEERKIQKVGKTTKMKLENNQNISIEYLAKQGCLNSYRS